MQDGQDLTSGPVAHTDGSCLGTPGPGGWGVHIEFPDGRVVEMGGGEDFTTNNRMELRAAIEAARAMDGLPSGTIITDSQYVKRGITEWMNGWKRKGWITSTGAPVVNRDLWEELDRESGPHITWEWTRGHSGDLGNERCDEIAGWFSKSVAALRAPGRAFVPRGSAGAPAAASAFSGRPAGRGNPPGTSYVSVVDGIVKRHATWPECEARVRGVGRARYKKVRSPQEEREVLQKWGITQADLFGV